MFLHVKTIDIIIKGMIHSIYDELQTRSFLCFMNVDYVSVYLVSLVSDLTMIGSCNWSSNPFETLFRLVFIPLSPRESSDRLAYREVRLGKVWTFGLLHYKG